MHSLVILRRFLPRLCGLTLLVGLNIALTTFCWMAPVLLRASIWGHVLQGCAIVVTLSQAVLVGLWLSWSDLGVPYRWALIAGPLGVLVLVAKWYLNSTQQVPSGDFVEMETLMVPLMLAVHAALLPLRWLCGWRLAFVDGLQTAGRRGQFTLQQWFVWCVALVLPAAWFSFVMEQPPSTALGLIVLLLYTLPLLAAALPAAFSRRWWLWSLLAVGWTVAVGWTICELRWYYLCSMGMGFAAFRTQLLLLCIAFPSGLATALVVNLLLLRAAGMRWVSVGGAPASIPAGGSFAEGERL